MKIQLHHLEVHTRKTTELIIFSDLINLFKGLLAKENPQ